MDVAYNSTHKGEDCKQRNSVQEGSVRSSRGAGRSLREEED